MYLKIVKKWLFTLSRRTKYGVDPVDDNAEAQKGRAEGDVEAEVVDVDINRMPHQHVVKVEKGKQNKRQHFETVNTSLVL